GAAGRARQQSGGEPRDLHRRRVGARALAQRERRGLASARLLRERLPHACSALLGSPGSRDRMGLDERGKHPALRGRADQRSVADRMGWTLSVPIRRGSDHGGRKVVNTTVCLAAARTVAYPQGSGHLWVYRQWALGLRALGCDVLWRDGMDLRDRDQQSVAEAG